MKAVGFILSHDDAKALCGHIAQQLGWPDDRRCDRTLRHAREWTEANGLPWSERRTWLHSSGSYCDCEVLLNSAASATAGDA